MRPLAHRTLFLALAVAAGTVLATPGSARADTINLATVGCGGAICGPLLYPTGSLTLTAAGGTFATKTRNGATGLGLTGQTLGEIDPGEVILGSFSTPVSLDAFTILFLFNGPEFGDLNETAQISINGGSAVATLSANAENNAVWSLGGATITSCGDTGLTGTGCFRIANPFGGALISDISFTAASAGTNLSLDSDFSLGSLDVSAVPSPTPEPASLILLASGGAIVAAARRRRRRS